MSPMETSVLHAIHARRPRFQGKFLILTTCALGALAMCGMALSLAMPFNARATMLSADEDLDELRHQELIGRRADVTVLRLDEVGEPVARLDLHFGGALPESEARLFELLNQFGFDGEQHLDASRVDRREDQGWRNVVLSSPPAPAGLPDMEFFDPQADLAVEIRRAESPTALTCSGAMAINFGATGAAGKNYYWYPSSDAIAVLAGPAVQSGANPDLYIAAWNGSSYVTIGSSTTPSADYVTTWQKSCQITKWRVRTYLHSGGAFFTWAGKFNAN